MKRVVIIIFLTNILLFAYSYDDFLLKTQAKIYPKLILLDKKIDKKLIDGKIQVGIVYDNDDFFTALLIKKLIKSMYGNKLDGYSFKIIPINMLNILNEKLNIFSYLYILKSIPDRLKTLSLYVKKYRIVTFTYDKNDLQYGFLFSINLEKKPILYMNRKALEKEFDFVPSLFQIVRLIDNV
ncbi:hypothetical protein [Nitrosophilus labii]|uniref:hypothetical protein n=1 Tax=Nitrosophilus labii TaxID=2706014 RepID=UPI001656FFB5|nr:hypothetical protein [Nitrosophilus labii]